MTTCSRSDTGSVPMPRTPSIFEEELSPSSMPRHKLAHSVDDLENLRDSACQASPSASAPLPARAFN